MKQKNVPLLLRVVRSLFPVLEKWAPFFADRIFRLVFYVPLKYPATDKEREATKSGKEISMEVEGRTIRGYQWGDPSKPYILLVHGWAGRATQFRKFIPRLLEKGFQVIGPDGPAHGRSDGIKTSILEFENMFKVVYQTYGEPAGIITHSFGGAAVLYAAMHGLPVNKLVNIASPSIADEIIKTYLRAINGSWGSATRFKKFVIRKTGKTFEEFTSLHAVRNLPRPVDLLMISDSLDKDVYILHAEELLKAYPSSRLIRTSGLGHTRILKDDQVIAKTVEFLTQGM